ncbi:unnamed protein product [Trichobilharzia regenti]|nr:unnamed protein product [Trichobilharzia regenti]
MDCMFQLFDGVEQDVLNLVINCEQLLTILIMPLLISISRITENETAQNIGGIVEMTGGNAKQLQSPSASDMTKVQVTFIGNFLSRLIVETKRAFNRLIERLIMSFKMSKPSRKARCGILTIVRTYIEFAEGSITVFATSSRLVDLERAHGELVRSLMTEIDRVASESVKTPGEVVQLGMCFFFIFFFIIFERFFMYTGTVVRILADHAHGPRFDPLPTHT